MSAFYWLPGRRVVVVQCNLGTPITGFNKSSCFLMVVEPLSPLLLFASVLSGINGALPVEKSLSVSICPNTSADFLFFFLAVALKNVQKSHGAFVCLSCRLCHSFLQQVDVVYKL